MTIMLRVVVIYCCVTNFYYDIGRMLSMLGDGTFCILASHVFMDITENPKNYSSIPNKLEAR